MKRGKKKNKTNRKKKKKVGGKIFNKYHDQGRGVITFENFAA